MNVIPGNNSLSAPIAVSSTRTELYKNTEKSLEQLRRRRNETQIELRKQKRDSVTDRRRNISSYEVWSDNEDIGEEDDKDDLTATQIIHMLTTTNIVDIPVKYIRHLRRLDPKEQEVGSVDSKQLLQLLMSDDIITKLNHCLTLENCSMSLLYEVVSLIAHICSKDKEKTVSMVKTGIVVNLLSLLSYDSFGIIEQSVIALTYIWTSSRETAEMLNSTKFIDILVALIDSETSVSPSKYVQNDSRISLMRGLSWALFTICHTRDQVAYNLSVDLIPYFVKLLKYSDTEVKTNVLKTLSTTTERVFSMEEDFETSPILKMVQLVVSNNSILKSIIEYLTSNEDEVVFNAIQIIGNIVSWGESFAQIVIQAKALQSFEVLLTHHNSKVQREGRTPSPT